MLTKDHFETNRRLCASGRCDKCHDEKVQKAAVVLYDFGRDGQIRYCGEHFERARFPIEPTLDQMQQQLEVAMR